MFRVFLDVALCSHVEVDQRLITLMMDAVHTSEMLVNFNVTTRRYMAEESKLNNNNNNYNLCIEVFP
jgi:hypothetical protein